MASRGWRAVDPGSRLALSIPSMSMLELICEYRALSLRRDMGERLDLDEHRRLSLTERALGYREGAGPGTDRRRFARADVEIPAMVEVGDAEHPVLITNL